MKHTSKGVICVYLTLTLLNTLAASFIWGINTLFLLNAGLDNTQAFAANAFFTAGEVIFEVPTGMLADTRGRRLSFLLGSITLMISTLAYLWMWKISGPFWGWALASMCLGLGFTFFSGATDAWLVDALQATHYQSSLDSVFAKGQIMVGIGMLTGSVAGGFIAQYSNLSVPYILRAIVLAISFFAAFFLMHDLGFHPKKSKSTIKEMNKIFVSSFKYGLKRTPAVRWLILAAPFTSGISIYVFYALQPYLLNLYGNPNAYSIAGLTAALVALAQIAGGFSVKYVRKLFKTRTAMIFIGTLFNTLILLAMGLTSNFWLVVIFIAIWALIFSGIQPVRQSFLNAQIPSEQRATVLSLDALMASSGGVLFQPILGKVADVWSYAGSYLVSGAITAIALPFVWLSNRTKVAADKIK